jgi:putative transposase
VKLRDRLIYKFHALALVGLFRRVFHSRCDLLLENLALRQQLLTLKRRKPRPRLARLDRLFWVVAKRLWPKWKQALIIVTPETIVRWHRVGFRLYWKLISGSQAVLGRKRVSKELRELIFRMVAENPTWGAPRIHGELLKLGFDLSERTVSRWVRKAPRNPESTRTLAGFSAQSP